MTNETDSTQESTVFNVDWGNPDTNPEYVSGPVDYQWMLDKHPEMVLHQAVAAVLRSQQAACKRVAEPIDIGPAIEAQAILPWVLTAWDHLKHLHYINDFSKLWRIALILPKPLHNLIRFQISHGHLERHQVNVLQAPDWHRLSWRSPADGDTFAVMAVSALDGYLPSIAMQNYKVDGVYTFRITSDTAEQA